jgi:hypothetical protein
MARETEFEAFGDGEDWHLNAIVSLDHFSSSDMAYIWGYEAAVGSLTAVAKFVANGGGEPYPGTNVMIDTIIYPQVFCARHFVELSLKCMLKRVRILGGKGARVSIPPDHHLIKLFEKLIEAVQQYSPSLLTYVERMGPMIGELSEVDKEGDAFRYAISKGNKPHLSSLERINIERFQDWFDRLRKLVHDVFFAIGAELDELDKGGATTRYKRDEVADLVGRLPPIDKWNNETLKPIYQAEVIARPDLSYGKFQEALTLIRSAPWLSIHLGSELTLPEVRPDLFGRVLAPKRSVNIEPEEWGALYCIFQVGKGEVPEEYEKLMKGAKETAIALKQWQADQAARHSTMTEEEIEAESNRAFSDPALTFDTSRMAFYECEGKIRAVLSERAYLFCRGLEKLGQPTLLASFRLACDNAGVSYAEPPPPDPSKATNWPTFRKRRGETEAE